VIRPVSASHDTVTSVRPPEMLQHDVRMQVSNERQLSLSVSNTIVRLTLRVDGDCSSVRCTYASLSYVRTCSTSIAFCSYSVVVNITYTRLCLHCLFCMSASVRGTKYLHLVVKWIFFTIMTTFIAS